MFLFTNGFHFIRSTVACPWAVNSGCGILWVILFPKVAPLSCATFFILNIYSTVIRSHFIHLILIQLIQIRAVFCLLAYLKLFQISFFFSMYPSMECLNPGINYPKETCVFLHRQPTVNWVTVWLQTCCALQCGLGFHNIPLPHF